MQKRSEDLKVGDVVSVWWQPDGATLVGIYPYVGPFEFVIGIGEFTASANKSGFASMSLIAGWQHEVLKGIE